MAEKIFIVDTDYTRIIQDGIRDEVVISNSDLLREEEKTAITRMISYLNSRFDVTNMFPALQVWNTNHLYLPGDFADYFGTFYRALDPGEDEDANQGKTPDTETTYWTDKTFPNIKTWDAAENPVAVGQYREKNGKFYRCAVAHTNQDPDVAANIYDPSGPSGYWIVDDPRDPHMVEICCEIALYKVHARISPDQIPQLRIDHHDMAIKYLEDIAAGKNAPLLPRLADTESNRNSVQYGSIEKRTYHY